MAERWTVGALGPDVIRAFRALLLLAIIGGAVLLTGNLMAKAQKPARNLLLGGR